MCERKLLFLLELLSNSINTWLHISTAPLGFAISRTRVGRTPQHKGSMCLIKRTRSEKQTPAGSRCIRVTGCGVGW